MNIHEAANHIENITSMGSVDTIEAWSIVRRVLVAKIYSNNENEQPKLSDGDCKAECCELKIGSLFEYCPKCGTFLW
jgi:hypothetical protein